VDLPQRRQGGIVPFGKAAFDESPGDANRFIGAQIGGF
jgi:hypothetical protein